MGIPWEAGEQDWRIRQGTDSGFRSRQLGPSSYRYRCLDCFNVFSLGVAAAATSMISCPRCGSFRVSEI